MQALLLPSSSPLQADAVRCSGAPPRSRYPRTLTLPFPQKPPSLLPRSPLQSSPFSFGGEISRIAENRRRSDGVVASAASAGFASPSDESDKEKLAQDVHAQYMLEYQNGPDDLIEPTPVLPSIIVAKRLESTSRSFKRLGSLGFWGQLVCTIVAAVILSFSVVITGKITSPATFYATSGGIAAAFVSAFWSFGYIRLSERLRRTANDPAKAPPRAEVVKSLKNGIVLNVLGMGAAILGMQATVGLLVAKALTTSAVPYYQGIPPGQSPVLALDVFLVQASANTILSHFLGLVFSLELLRSVTLPNVQGVPIPKAA